MAANATHERTGRGQGIVREFGHPHEGAITALSAGVGTERRHVLGLD